MAGLLLYARDYHKEAFKSSDGSHHYEIRPIEGDFYSITETSWEKITSLCSGYGIPVDCWPVYESSIDVPIEDVRMKNAGLRDALLAIPNTAVQSEPWLVKIIDRVRLGDLIVFCRLY